MRGYRFVWRPNWFAGHLLVLAAAITMIFLGRWQMHVSEHKHFSLQNFGYALQWWAFSAFAVAFWIKIVHDRARADRGVEAAEPPARTSEPVAYRRYVMPDHAATAASAADDPELARYNAYLAALNRDGHR